MPHAFLDLLAEPPRLTFATPVALTSKRERTTQGYLWIYDVAIARTGPQDYRANEVPVEPGPMGYVVVEREPEDVFDPATLASFEGVPITNDHPTVMVGPENYREHLVGVIRNVRRGEGRQSHLMLADALIYCADAIADIESGKRQVSAGYEANYVRLEAGRGKQTNIIGNHLAIVDRGRCGPVCAFGDKESEPMTTTAPVTPSRVPAVRAKAMDRKTRCFDRAFKAFRDNDPEAFVEEIQEAIETAVEEATENAPDQMETIKQAVAEAIAPIMETMDGLRGRMDAFDAKFKDEDKDDEDDKDKKKTEDEEMDPTLGEEEPTVESPIEPELVTDAAFRDTAARAEILSPGLRMATADSLTDDKARGAAITAHKRAALKNYYRDHAEMAPVLLGMKTAPDFGAMAPAAVHLAFMGASEVAKAQNNSRVTKRILVSDAQPAARMTAAERNEANRAFWAKHSA
ncbi:DUF2213 domain-containing protein [Methylobacterium sp. 1973]|uniref:DUF2213 domain-containing protein n=1 Tax=Methylobacterium sp. 1973 TaxID=3156421 RepID=UPI00339B4384